MDTQNCGQKKAHGNHMEHQGRTNITTKLVSFENIYWVGKEVCIKFLVRMNFGKS